MDIEPAPSFLSQIGAPFSRLSTSIFLFFFQEHSNASDPKNLATTIITTNIIQTKYESKSSEQCSVFRATFHVAWSL